MSSPRSNAIMTKDAQAAAAVVIRIQMRSWTPPENRVGGLLTEPLKQRPRRRAHEPCCGTARRQREMMPARSRASLSACRCDSGCH